MNLSLPYASETNPQMFSSPDGADVPERIPYPSPSLKLDDLMDDEAQRCIAYAAHRTGVDMKELLSFVAKDWYDISGDASGSFLRQQIAFQKKEDKKRETSKRKASKAH